MAKSSDQETPKDQGHNPERKLTIQDVRDARNNPDHVLHDPEHPEHKDFEEVSRSISYIPKSVKVNFPYPPLTEAVEELTEEDFRPDPLKPPVLDHDVIMQHTRQELDAVTKEFSEQKRKGINRIIPQGE
ncbi:hypothetical protein [Corynebacterium camporealensis]